MPSSAARARESGGRDETPTLGRRAPAPCKGAHYFAAQEQAVQDHRHRATKIGGSPKSRTRASEQPLLPSWSRRGRWWPVRAFLRHRAVSLKNGGSGSWPPAARRESSAFCDFNNCVIVSTSCACVRTAPASTVSTESAISHTLAFPFSVHLVGHGLTVNSVAFCGYVYEHSRCCARHSAVCGQ